MRKLLILLVPVAFLFSCNQEIPAEQYRVQAHSQCMKQMAKKFLEEGATDAEKEKFCDCYSDWLVGEAETVTVGEMMKKATGVDEMTTALDGCKTNSKTIEEPITAPVVEEQPESNTNQPETH